MKDKPFHLVSERQDEKERVSSLPILSMKDKIRRDRRTPSILSMKDKMKRDE